MSNLRTSHSSQNAQLSDITREGSEQDRPAARGIVTMRRRITVNLATLGGVVISGRTLEHPREIVLFRTPVQGVLAFVEHRIFRLPESLDRHLSE